MPTARLSPKTLVVDRATMVALQSLVGYAPRNSSFAVETLQHINIGLTQLEQKERWLLAELAITRAQIVAQERLYHTSILGAKDEVVVQFGNDSPEVKAIGRKRKSERKRPKRKAALAD